MAQLAAAYWGHPGRDLTMVGVTGTNGKTTVTHLLGAVAAYAGLPAAVLGTLSGVRTTPGGHRELQRDRWPPVRGTAPGERPRPGGGQRRCRATPWSSTGWTP